jgi:ketosteroid isomerase-like protein
VTEEMAMTEESITDADLAALVHLCDDAAGALIRGDVSGYLRRISHAPDYTLLAPLGGPPRHGFDESPNALAELARFFGGGEAEVELVASYSSGDLAVLVLIERQHGEVGGLPDQDWSLRVTLVFRRVGAGWQLAHRHADPLVREPGFERVAEVARGAG